MPNQFEKATTKTLDNETASKIAAEQKIERVADKAAGKAANTEKRYDQDHTIFSN